MGGHLPLAVVLHVDFHGMNPISRLVPRFDVDVTAQYGCLSIHPDLRVALGERFVSSGTRDSRDILCLALCFAVGVKEGQVIGQKALEEIALGRPV